MPSDEQQLQSLIKQCIVEAIDKQLMPHLTNDAPTRMKVALACYDLAKLLIVNDKDLDTWKTVLKDDLASIDAQENTLESVLH